MRDQPIRVEQARFVDDPVLGVGEEVRIRKRGLRDTRTGTLAAEGMQDTGIGSLAGKEVHSRRVMKEGARADRGNDAMESTQSNGYRSQGVRAAGR